MSTQKVTRTIKDEAICLGVNRRPLAPKYRIAAANVHRQ